MGAKLQARAIDGVIAALAERQHGVVSRAQLMRLGLGTRAIGHRLECGRLHRVHRGVYAVGHRVLSTDASWMAAVLSAGAGAVLSHRSAAALWGIRGATAGRIDVSAPRAVRSRPGLRCHEALLPADEVTIARGIPVTTPPRTLLDLARVLGPRRLERALEQAEMLRLADALSLADLVARHPGRRGAVAIRRVLAAGALGTTVTRSELEERFLALLDSAGLPRPAVNAALQLGGTWIEADCAWRAERLVVELDGYATHATRSAFERDRARDRTLQAAGWRVLRVTWRHLHEDPDTIASELRTMLAAGEHHAPKDASRRP